MTETNRAVTALGLPGGGTHRTTSTVDTTELRRAPGGAVTGSVRRGAVPDQVGAEQAALDALRGLGVALAGAPVQSLTATVVVRTAPGAPTTRTGATLARLETRAGPILVGSAIGAAPPAVETPRAIAARPPSGWRDLPLVLAPPVAAVLFSGVRLALASRRGTELRHQRAGRAIGPPLTLTDVPLTHPEGAHDDAGEPARRDHLIEDGRLAAPVAASRSGRTPAGRAYWDHDAGVAGAPPMVRLEVTGPSAAPPDEAIELHWCVEHLQRYQTDGTLRLTCLARPRTAPHGWFRAELLGRPVALLRSATGLAGAPQETCTEDQVRTSALVLPSANHVATTRGGRLDPV